VLQIAETSDPRLHLGGAEGKSGHVGAARHDALGQGLGERTDRIAAMEVAAGGRVGARACAAAADGVAGGAAGLGQRRTLRVRLGFSGPQPAPNSSSAKPARRIMAGTS